MMKTPGIFHFEKHSSKIKTVLSLSAKILAGIRILFKILVNRLKNPKMFDLFKEVSWLHF